MASYSSSNLELDLNLKPSYLPKTIPDILKEVSEIENDSDKLSCLDAYICQHEEELNNISAFKIQIPQTLLLLMEGLNKLKEESIKIRNGMKSENNGKPASPLVELTLGLKRKHCEADQATGLALSENNYGNKGNSLMSFASPQPNWNHQNNNHKQFIDFIRAPRQDQNPGIPLKESNLGLSIGEKAFTSSKPCATNNGAGVDCGLTLKAGNQPLNYQPNPSITTQPNWRKSTRRCWSPKLHEKFVDALFTLGGIEVATPKQIREVMNVEGLTNDQVKSHLQKFRLNCRRLLAPANHADGSVLNVQAPPNYIRYPNLPPLQGSQAQHYSYREGPLNRKPRGY